MCQIGQEMDYRSVGSSFLIKTDALDTTLFPLQNIPKLKWFAR
nr:hypothetical protein AgrTiEU6_29 [Agrobacterium tumefaciens]